MIFCPHTGLNLIAKSLFVQRSQLDRKKHFFKVILCLQELSAQLVKLQR